MYIFLILTIIFAIFEIYATNKGRRNLEFVAKPAVMICLFTWLWLATGLRSVSFWFGLGILFSLIGDILFLWLDRFFLLGVLAFLFAQISYILGFRSEFPSLTAWSGVILLILATSGIRLTRRIVSSMRKNGQTRLVGPVIIYAAVISIMLYAAMLTLSDMTWKAGASLLVAAGAFLFYISDLLLAWNKFVSPLTGGRTLNIALYELGQMMLVAGVIAQAG